MIQLEQLQPRAAIRGIIPDALVVVVSVQWFGSEALELTYKASTGRVANELLYRDDEARLDVIEQGRPWSFDGDGALFRLVSKAQPIRLAHHLRAAIDWGSNADRAAVARKLGLRRAGGSAALPSDAGSRPPESRLDARDGRRPRPHSPARAARHGALGEAP
jgi:hypothetical protein